MVILVSTDNSLLYCCMVMLTYCFCCLSVCFCDFWCIARFEKSGINNELLDLKCKLVISWRHAVVSGVLVRF